MVSNCADTLFGNFGQKAAGELECGEQGSGDGEVDLVVGNGLDDLVDCGEDGNLVEEVGEDKSFLFDLSDWFGRALGVVVTAEFGAVDCGSRTWPAVVEGLKALGWHKSSLMK